MRTIALGISTPSTFSGPDSCQRMRVNDTSDTSELTAPTARVVDTEVKVAMSSWMRWSGLSTGVEVKRPRW